MLWARNRVRSVVAFSGGRSLRDVRRQTTVGGIALYALVVDGDGQLQVESGRRPPERGPGLALIRVTIAGVCRTDMELVEGYMNFRGVLGHEFVGVVEDADDNALVGKRVVGGINIECGDCDMCGRGLGRHCRRVRVLGIHDWDGAFAEWMVLPERNLLVVPDGVSDRQAVFVEPLAAAVEILEQVHVRPDDRVAVVGDGRLGLMCAQVLARTGCELLLIGRHRAKLAIVEERGVATMTVDEIGSTRSTRSIASTDPAIACDIRPDLDKQFDVVVEATGRPGGLELAQQLVRSRGTLVLKTTIHEAVPIDVADIVVREITLIGSRCGPFEPALRLLEQGAIDTEPFIHAQYDLRDGVAAMEHAVRPGVLKVLIRCGPERNDARGPRADELV